jgi:hypothetical protein
MKWCRLLLIFNLFFNATIGFILPQIFREWHPVAIYDTIDKTKPYPINYGKLPLVLWFNDTTPQTAIGYCKHLGARLEKGFINNNCLVCPNHLTAHNSLDTIGTTMVKDGIVWWSYKNLKRTPPSLYNKNSANFQHFHMDIENSLQNIVLEFMYFNDNSKEKSVRNKFLIKKKLFNMEYRLFYKYPFYLKGSINKKINFGINFLPLEENKTRLFIYSNVEVEYLLYYYLSSKLFNLKNYDNNTIFKFLLVLKDVKDNNYLKKIYLLFDKYMFPNESNVFSFYKYRQFY